MEKTKEVIHYLNSAQYCLNTKGAVIRAFNYDEQRKEDKRYPEFRVYSNDVIRNNAVLRALNREHHHQPRRGDFELCFTNKRGEIIGYCCYKIAGNKIVIEQIKNQGLREGTREFAIFKSIPWREMLVGVLEKMAGDCGMSSICIDQRYGNVAEHSGFSRNCRFYEKIIKGQYIF